MEVNAPAGTIVSPDQFARGQATARHGRRSEIYQCIVCRSSLVEDTGDVLRCTGCEARYPVRHNILDTLIEPSPDALQELRGMAEEAGASSEDWKSVCLRVVQSASTFQDRMRISATEPNQYYQQTALHFEQASEFLDIYSSQRVLEIGSETDYYFLKEFHRRGAQCHAVNLYFEYQEPDDYADWPEKTLADMNHLPFKNATFDLVVFSATLHHSPDIERTMTEVRRILSPQGVVLVLSEQIGGVFKREDRYTHRNKLIHETYHSFKHYDSAFAKAGFEPSYLFSRYFEQKLTSGDINVNRRFARIGKVAATLWKIPAFRTLAAKQLLITWHVLFGFPLNAILRKIETR
jgi:SAM-dependent methyltransferase